MNAPENDFDAHREILSGIAPQLTDGDDPQFWNVAIREVYGEAEFLLNKSGGSSIIATTIGACSHWQRPHQHRWLVDGSFAAPYGYGCSGKSFNIHALPVFDWSQTFLWSPEQCRWGAVSKMPGKRVLVLRVALPSRTLCHPQAAVHTVWTPKAPLAGGGKVLRLYGFRVRRGSWECTASEGSAADFEVASLGAR